jgi:hypothetical protein
MGKREHVLTFSLNINLTRNQVKTAIEMNQHGRYLCNTLADYVDAMLNYQDEAWVSHVGAEVKIEDSATLNWRSGAKA